MPELFLAQVHIGCSTIPYRPTSAVYVRCLFAVNVWKGKKRTVIINDEMKPPTVTHGVSILSYADSISRRRQMLRFDMLISVQTDKNMSVLTSLLSCKQSDIQASLV